MQVSDRKLAWAALFVFAVIALELAWFLFIGPPEGTPACGTGNAPQCDLPWWDSAAFWTASFTFALTVSTGLLWWQTRRLAEGAEDQTEKMVSYIAAAEKAADAADRHAKAAVGAELPILQILSCKSIYERDNGKDAWINNLSPVFEIKNFGRTTAVVVEVIANIGLGYVFDTPPDLVQYNRYPEARAIGANEIKEFQDFYAKQGLDKSAVDEWVSSDAEKVFIFGKIIYRDFSGIHEQGFLYLWVAKSRAFVSFEQRTDYYKQT